MGGGWLTRWNEWIYSAIFHRKLFINLFITPSKIIIINNNCWLIDSEDERIAIDALHPGKIKSTEKEKSKWTPNRPKIKQEILVEKSPVKISCTVKLYNKIDPKYEPNLPKLGQLKVPKPPHDGNAALMGQGIGRKIFNCYRSKRLRLGATQTQRSSINPASPNDASNI